MAAAAVLATRTSVVGDRKRVQARLDDVADTNTWDSGLIAIDDGSISVSFQDASAVAADSIAIASVSGGIVTFQAAGTARDVNIQVTGY